MRDIREALNTARDVDGKYRVRVVRNSVGFDEVHKVMYGQKGSPDLWGVLRGGIAFGCEVKTPEGRASKYQRAWWRAARMWGWRGGFARSVPEAMALLDAADGGAAHGR